MNVGELGRRFSVSRSTLLYYDRKGVLRPSRRRANGYRDYTEADAKRLEQVVLYRKAGLSLRDIRPLLDNPGASLGATLEKQLQVLVEQIDGLRRRQAMIVSLLRKPRLLERFQIINRKTWTALLRAAGFDDAALVRWHQDFERHDPVRHRRFLELLGIPEAEIAMIRAWSRGEREAPVTARRGKAARRGRAGRPRSRRP